MFLSRRIGLPLYFLLLLLLALGLNLLRGFNLARNHQRQLEPRRVSTVLDLRTGTAPSLTVDSERGYLLVRLPDSRSGSLALREILPGRTLLRWQERLAGEGDWLVVPLAGLKEGEFGLCWAAPEADETVQLEEQLDTERNWLGRFTLE
jgi:hypothetical protein